MFIRSLHALYLSLALLLPLCVVTAPARAEVTVSLITFGPGELTFEKFGHTALRVRDDSNGLDIAYNWGLFDYENEADLLARFVQGRLDYWMEGFGGRETIDAYARANRTVWEQELNLTAEQARALLTFLMWNERPENRGYRYDYYKDNCTTRVRDAIDNSIGGAIAKQLKGAATHTTYRDHTRRITAVDVPLYTALQTVLADPIDQPLDAWHEAFLPFELQRQIREVKTTDAAGNVVPLVRREVQLATGTRPMPMATVPRYWPGYLAFGVVFGGILVALAGPARRSRVARLALYLPVALWAGVAGLFGFVMAFAWVGTDHVVAYANENLLQMNVLLLLLIPLGLFAMLGRLRRTVFTLAAIAAGLSVLGLLLKVLPAFDQVNGDIIALSLPINLGVAIAFSRLLPQWQPKSTQSNDPASLTVAAGKATQS